MLPLVASMLALALGAGAARLWALRIPILRLDPDADPAARRAALDAWLSGLHRAGAFNGSVLLARGDEILYASSHGTSGPDGQTAITDRSSFNLASVSKPFTALAVVLLHEREALHYDDLLSTHVPELAYLEGVTLRHLLHHTSGVPDYMALAKRHGTLATTDLVDTRTVLDLLTRHRPPLAFRPGHRFAYSNTGYVLLADVVARVSGQPFGAFLAQHVFGPLGMTDSAVVTRRSADSPARRVYGFRRAWGVFGGPRRPHDLGVWDGVVGDGGVYASAHDLWVWHHALASGRLVRPEAYAEAYRSGTLADGTATGYGFGWLVQEGVSAEHAGGWLGFATYLYRDLRDDGLIVLLDHGTNALRVTPVGFRWSSIAFNLQHALAHL